jgi:hypothetical protein
MMQGKSVTRLLTAGVLVSASAFAGCATSDVDKLRAELADVSAIANEAKAAGDEAKQAAQAASGAAADAKSAADQAKATADEAKAMSEATDAKIDRMFKKSMYK